MQETNNYSVAKENYSSEDVFTGSNSADIREEFSGIPDSLTRLLELDNQMHGREPIERRDVSMAMFARTNQEAYKDLAKEIQEVGYQFFRYVNGEIINSSWRYITDVLLYRDSSVTYYGTANCAPTPAIPNHQLGIPVALQNYFSVVTSKQQFGGIPPLVENVTFHDGKTSINQVVASFTYKPKFGQLKAPLKYIRSGLPSTEPLSATLQVHTNGNYINTASANWSSTSTNDTGARGTMSQSTGAPFNDSTTFDLVFGYEKPIEKSQFLKQGPWGQYHNAEIQPSVHVGLQAIPSLTANHITMPIANWTDAQADWDVLVEMDVCEYTPTKLPYAGGANVPAGDVIYMTSTVEPAQNACTYAGLYPNNSIRNP